MVLYQCSLLCGCKKAMNKSQKQVRKGLRSGIFRATVGILSAISFFYFFTKVSIEIHLVRELEQRDNIIQTCIELTLQTARERGNSAIWVAGKGTNLVAKENMEAARAQVDIFRAEVEKLYSNPIARYDDLEKALSALDELPDFRLRVDDVANTGILGNETLAFYTDINALFVDFELFESFSKFEDTSRGLYTIIRESLLNEFTGIERGTFAALFERGYYTSQDEFLDIINILSQKSETEKELDVLLRDEHLQVSTDVKNSASVREAIRITDEMRNTAINVNFFETADFLAFNRANPFTIDPDEWFGNMTTIIDSKRTLRAVLFDDHKKVQRKHLTQTIIDACIAFIALCLEVTACSTLIYLAWPVLKLFWRLERDSKRFETSRRTDTAGTSTKEDDDDVEDHNDMVLAMSEERM
mmetsp:Transcript_96/g.104  ORF Transcript_96/g.104 Transcript_96/m.104 type:complete len:415 (+) Transcript_96:80-1324(+)